MSSTSSSLAEEILAHRCYRRTHGECGRHSRRWRTHGILVPHLIKTAPHIIVATDPGSACRRPRRRCRGDFGPSSLSQPFLPGLLYFLPLPTNSACTCRLLLQKICSFFSVDRPICRQTLDYRLKHCSSAKTNHGLAHLQRRMSFGGGGHLLRLP